MELHVAGEGLKLTPRVLASLEGHVVILNVSEKVGRIVDEIGLGSGDERPGGEPQPARLTQSPSRNWAA